MTVEHDPLCLTPECDLDCPGYSDCAHHCDCYVIAKVRADEREKAAQRLETIKLITSRPDGFLVYLDDAISAVRGES